MKIISAGLTRLLIAGLLEPDGLVYDRGGSYSSMRIRSITPLLVIVGGRSS